MRFGRSIRWAVVLAAAAAAGCTGNGEGLDQNGQPLGSGGSGGPLTADFTSIQDNVFTPICTRCHIGASAPQGLQLDAAHSYALLVGVPSAEKASLLRVDPGKPDSSYLVLKLEGASGIAGGQMPLGGPYLPQSTIDVIRQWIINGAQRPQTVAHVEQRLSFEVVATSPADTATVAAPVREIVVSFSSDVDIALVNATTLQVEPVAGGEFLNPTSTPIPSTFEIAPGNPATVLIHPVSPLVPGKYRVTVRGTGDSGALASVFGMGLGADYQFVFTVEPSR